MKQQVTQAEYSQLQARLAEATARYEAAQVAKAHAHKLSGDPDMHEDAGAEEAYRQILMWGSQVERLGSLLANVQVIDSPTEYVRSVQLGYKVSLLVNGVRMEKILGGPQARFDKGQIASTSKLGQAILGQVVGATVSYETVDGVIQVEILDVLLP